MAGMFFLLSIMSTGRSLQSFLMIAVLCTYELLTFYGEQNEWTSLCVVFGNMSYSLLALVAMTSRTIWLLYFIWPSFSGQRFAILCNNCNITSTLWYASYIVLLSALFIVLFYQSACDSKKSYCANRE
ncbi:unnamed protein product [Protopolystoma xenopodis]|uniref:Uncharacterized protein n=1 Tax=Protopolystoma xenopodis TaxID=117903 RepID=A0A3S5A4Y2_9PLAT|nr:unnamed protein product [Protopolystoma xenopodis]